MLLYIFNVTVILSKNCLHFKYLLTCRLLKRFDFPTMKFSLYFMGYAAAADIPSDPAECSIWVFKQMATLELTQ